ncbi:hypothetical protein FB45DRAFT_924295 [Roridomyces roridus]|uniref:DUF6534 domain-containing protein n=1 Tax=Roridomyces roridus TaxID=1738132 RepID=A0AAD7BLW7_9AGAR|nr:hypothetical protein FB45DRAFT_924295 [Roridomyces roridus]
MSSAAAESTYLGVFLGSYMSAMFYGLTSLQVFFYFRAERTKRDDRILKLMVAVLWVMDTADSVMIAMAVYFVDISHPQDALVAPIYWAFLAAFFIESIMEGAMRSFYCHRIWKLSHHNFGLTGAAIILALVALVFSLWIPAAGIHLSPFGIRSFKSITLTFVISCVIADTLIACTMAYLLWKMNKATSRQQTSTVIHGLILYAVSTGLLTSIVAIALLITYLASASLAYSGVRLVVGKLYFNAFLANLNTRPYLRNQLSHLPGSTELESQPTSGSESHGLRFLPGRHRAVVHDTNLGTKTTHAKTMKPHLDTEVALNQNTHVVKILSNSSAEECV